MTMQVNTLEHRLPPTVQIHLTIDPESECEWVLLFYRRNTTTHAQNYTECKIIC